MAITDLTNTKWIIKDYFTAPSASTTWNINFNSSGSSYSSLQITPTVYIYYGNDMIYDSTDVGWYNESYRTIEINGGSSVTNPDLINWLLLNATQINGTTLLNTKWVIKSAPTPLLDAAFSINFNSNGNAYSYLGMNGTTLVYGSTTTYSNSWAAQEYRVIEITGGNDISNSNLLSWLQANATQVQVSTLENTKWKIIFSPDLTGYENFSSLFKSNDTTYELFEITSGQLDYVDDNLTSTTVYSSNAWFNELYRNIEILSTGSAAINPDFIVWLESNAVLLSPTSFDSQISIGDTQINKCYLGDVEIAKIYLGDTLVFGGTSNQLETPTIEIDENDLVIEAVENGQFYDVYADNEVVYTIGVPIYVKISESYLSYKSYLKIYDGQDNTGTLLYESTGANTPASSSLKLTCNSGYIYVECSHAINSEATYIISQGTDNISLKSIEDGYADPVYAIFTVIGTGIISLEIEYSD